MSLKLHYFCNNFFFKSECSCVYLPQCMYKFDILKHEVVKDQNLLNMQKSTNCSAANAMLFKQGLSINSVSQFTITVITYFQCSVHTVLAMMMSLKLGTTSG